MQIQFSTLCRFYSIAFLIPNFCKKFLLNSMFYVFIFYSRTFFSWQTVTVADLILYTILTISQNIESEEIYRNFLKTIIEYLKQFCDCGLLYELLNDFEAEAPTSYKTTKMASLQLSIPMTVFLLQQIKTPSNKELFIELSKFIFKNKLFVF